MNAIAKMACTGLKKGSFHLFTHCKWGRIIFGTPHFDPIFGRKITEFQGIVLENHICDTCLTHFPPKKHPIIKSFGDFRRAQTGHHQLKLRQNYLLWHSIWYMTIDEKVFFLPPLAFVDPFWHPPL